MKDWTGNSKSTFTTLGASSHSLGEREEMDFYATEPKATELLLEKETFSHNVWECACGAGDISKVLENNSYNVRSTDLVYRGYGEKESLDFLSELMNSEKWNGDIVSNPPYKYATEFVRKALSLIDNGHKVAMFLRIQFLEGADRRKLFEQYPPRKVYVASKRLNCPKNGIYTKENLQGAMCYAWFVWEKGYKGLPEIDWIN